MPRQMVLPGDMMKRSRESGESYGAYVLVDIFTICADIDKAASIYVFPAYAATSNQVVGKIGLRTSSVVQSSCR